MLELNFSSPSAASVFSKSFQAAGNIISRVKKNTSIPVGLKLSPTLEPLEAFITTCIDAGLDFITAHNAPGGIVIDGNKCWSCGFCVGICPAGAIELRDRQDKDRLIWNNQGVAESF